MTESIADKKTNPWKARTPLHDSPGSMGQQSHRVRQHHARSSRAERGGRIRRHVEDFFFRTGGCVLHPTILILPSTFSFPRFPRSNAIPALCPMRLYLLRSQCRSHLPTPFPLRPHPLPPCSCITPFADYARLGLCCSSGRPLVPCQGACGRRRCFPY